MAPLQWVVNRPKRGMTLPLGCWFRGRSSATSRATCSPSAPCASAGSSAGITWRSLLAHAPRCRHHARRPANSQALAGLVDRASPPLRRARSRARPARCPAEAPELMEMPRMPDRTLDGLPAELRAGGPGVHAAKPLLRGPKRARRRRRASTRPGSRRRFGPDWHAAPSRASSRAPRARYPAASRASGTHTSPRPCSWWTVSRSSTSSWPAARSPDARRGGGASTGRPRTVSPGCGAVPRRRRAPVGLPARREDRRLPLHWSSRWPRSPTSR